jgi:peroxiredoxin (alkyl hydroperoxide reductase subunit C)
VRFYAEHGEVCPANWKPGDRGMHADAERAQEYFGNVYKEGSPAAGDDGLAPGLEAVKSRRDFDALLSGGKPFVLYVGAPWCGKCKQLSPYIVELAEKHPGLTFVKMDSTAEPVEQIAQELGVKALPATHFYGSDGKPALPPITGYKRRPLEEAVAKLAEVASTGGGGK